MRKYIFHQIKEYYDKQNSQESPEELASKIKSGTVQVPDYAKGKKTAYNG